MACSARGCLHREEVLALQAPAARPCSCGRGKIRRAAVGPTTQALETLDNGAMPRAVTRLTDAERLHRDRAAGADPLAGGATYELPKEK